MLRAACSLVGAGALAGRFAGARPAVVAELLEVIIELGQRRRTEAGGFAT